MAQWIQSEKGQLALRLTFISNPYWVDKDGKFWFNDETQCDVCGPYDTLEECRKECIRYGRSLDVKQALSTPRHSENCMCRECTGEYH